MNAAIAAKQVLSVLQRVVNSEVFRDADDAKRLLLFLVLEVLANRAVTPCTAAVGRALFGRPPGVDSRLRKVVEMNIAQLRTRLQRYFAAEGAAEAVQLHLSPEHFEVALCKALDPPEWATLPSLAFDGYDCSGETDEQRHFCQHLFGAVCTALAASDEIVLMTPAHARHTPATPPVRREAGAVSDFGMTLSFRWTATTLRVFMKVTDTRVGSLLWIDAHEFDVQPDGFQDLEARVIAYLSNGLAFADVGHRRSVAVDRGVRR